MYTHICIYMYIFGIEVENLDFEVDQLDFEIENLDVR